MAGVLLSLPTILQAERKSSDSDSSPSTGASPTEPVSPSESCLETEQVLERDNETERKAPYPDIITDGMHFCDRQGREVVLRGVNLSGSTKVPFSPPSSTHLLHGFYDYKHVSFVGRPFPLEEADEHLSRLKAWGFNCLRLLVTWEALEHEAPGKYDMEYVSYVRQVVLKCQQYQFLVYIDPHQDVWSRWTGGDGAPAWTLSAVGFDITKLHETGASFCHQHFASSKLSNSSRPSPGADLGASSMPLPVAPTQGPAVTTRATATLSSLPTDLPPAASMPIRSSVSPPPSPPPAAESFSPKEIGTSTKLPPTTHHVAPHTPSPLLPPKMIWPTNYFKLGCATMFTLFWAGNHFAPLLKVDGIPIQQYLQSHYIQAIAILARELSDLSNVIGYGTLNEPSVGYIGCVSLDTTFGELRKGSLPTPLQAMALASGLSLPIGFYSGGANSFVLGRPDMYQTINPRHQSAWLAGRECVWRMHGVWDLNKATGQPVLLKPHYFVLTDNRTFGRDFFLPFAQKFAAAIRASGTSGGNVNRILFVELPPLEFGLSAFPEITRQELCNSVNATHWYDGTTLFMGTFREWASINTLAKRPVVGRGAVKQMMKNQLAHIKELGEKQMHGVPTLIGEVGIPFNLSEAAAYKTGDWTECERAMEASMGALDANMLSYTLWCYCPDNSNAFGDQWNGEDFSIFSRNQQKPDWKERDDLHSGARARVAFLRPYAQKVGGRILEMNFNREQRTFVLEFQETQEQTAAQDFLHASASVPTTSSSLLDNLPSALLTEIFLPALQFPNGFDVVVSDGHYETRDNGHGSRTLLYSPTRPAHTPTSHHPPLPDHVCNRVSATAAVPIRKSVTSTAIDGLAAADKHSERPPHHRATSVPPSIHADSRRAADSKAVPGLHWIVVRDRQIAQRDAAAAAAAGKPSECLIC